MPLHNKKHQQMTRAQLKALSTSRYASGSRHAQKAYNSASNRDKAAQSFISADNDSQAQPQTLRKKRLGTQLAHHEHFADHATSQTPPNPTEIHSRNSAVSYYAKKRIATTKKKILRTIGFSCLGFLVTVGVALAAVVGYLYMINGQITGRVGKDLLATLTDTSNDEPFYTLLLGVDKDEDRAEGSTYGPSDSAYRTDTIILTRVDPKNKKITMVSIPRDTYVDLGKHGKQKINAAYSVGGAAYAVQVVEKFSGVKISHYAEVDMDGFAQVVDSIGGVDVDLPVPVKDPNYTKIDLPAGPQHLDGHTAALLGRSRHAYDKYGDGDTFRAANQRMLIGNVMKKVLSSGPAGIASSITTMAKFVTTDMNVTDIIALSTKFVGMDINNDIYSGLCPTISKYINKTWYEICETKKWQEMIKRVDTGLPPFDSEKENTSKGIAGSVGISSSSDGDQTGNTSENSQEDISFEGSVAVLNASGKQGVAKQKASTLANKGFSAQPGNSRKVLQNSVVYYTQGNEAKAKGVAKTLGIATKPQLNKGQFDSGTDCVVLIGKDLL